MQNTYKLLGFTAAILLNTSPALAIPKSDFDFNRADSNPTDFHTKTYTNGLTGDSANAFQHFVNTDALALNLSTINSRKLDSSQLKINFDKNVKVYFVNEGAQYRNNLNIISTGTTNLSGSVFDDISCLEAGCSYPQTDGWYTLNPDDTLELGDYVSIGNIQSGSSLEFTLNSRVLDNYSAFHQTLYTDNSLNSGGGVIAYEYEGYLILAWEDAGDGDYNDVVFAIDIGQENLDCIPSEGELVNPQCASFLFAD